MISANSSFHCAAASLALLSTAVAAHAQSTIYVDRSAPAGGDGSSWNKALNDLQDAMDLAHRLIATTWPLEIRLAKGVYTPDRGTLNRDMYFSMASGVTLLGGFAGFGADDPDEQDPKAFVSVLSGDLKRDDEPGFVNYEDNSRVILQVNADVHTSTVQGCTISGASSAGAVVATTYLGAITSRSGEAVTLVSCRVEKNLTAASVMIGANVQMIDCVIADNRSSGPLFSARSGPIARCTIAGNSVTGAGNALAQVSGMVVASVFAENVVASGGGLSINGAQIFNCTFAGNTASRGPAIEDLNNYDQSAVGNCIFNGNVSTDTTVQAHQVLITVPQNYSTVWPVNFLDRGAADVLISGGGALKATYVTGDPGFVSPSGADGNLGTWSDNDYHLRAHSPCIDRGDSSFAPYVVLGYVDRDGRGPVDDPATPNTGAGLVPYLDLGAYEFIPACVADFDSSGTVNVADIFAYVKAFFARDPSADIDRSGSVTVQDLFDFLTAWFAGCS